MNQPNYNTALYMRLSRDDEGYGDSISIETQRTILRKFAQDNQLRIYDEYIDDGWSGTNFERPNFKRMMADIESGKVNCVVTKDLSRFGREHIMMDYYLEFVFPEKRVRYIAVAENEDTEKGLSDFVPFKNLFNEWFAKDTSRKVKNSLAAKFEAGERVSAYAPLGYKKHPDVKNKLVIDEETSWIIRRIYTLAFYGAGAAKITRTLTQEKVPTPGWLNYQRDGTFANIYRDAPEESGMPGQLHRSRASSRMRRISATPSTTVRRISHTKTKSGYASRRVNGCVSREPRKQSFPKRTLSVYSSKSPPGEGNKRTQPHKYLPDWYVVRTVDGQ